MRCAFPLSPSIRTGFVTLCRALPCCPYWFAYGLIQGIHTWKNQYRKSLYACFFYSITLLSFTCPQKQVCPHLPQSSWTLTFSWKWHQNLRKLIFPHCTTMSPCWMCWFLQQFSYFKCHVWRDIKGALCKNYIRLQHKKNELKISTGCDGKISFDNICYS